MLDHWSQVDLERKETLGSLYAVISTCSFAFGPILAKLAYRENIERRDDWSY